MKKSWTVATLNARRNSSLRPMWASEAIVFVTVVPMLAPMINGTALATGIGFSGAATNPTIIAVVTDELCTRVVVKMPIMRPTNGFSVAAKNESSTPSPSARKPAPRPLTATRNT